VLKKDEVIKGKKDLDCICIDSSYILEEKNENSAIFPKDNNSLLFSDLSDTPYIFQSQSLCEICFPKLIKLNKNVLIGSLNSEEKSKSTNGFFSRFKKSIFNTFQLSSPPPVIENPPSSNLIQSSSFDSIDFPYKLNSQTINQKKDIHRENLLVEPKNLQSFSSLVQNQNMFETKLAFEKILLFL
jgi:hypothetical protein